MQLKLLRQFVILIMIPLFIGYLTGEPSGGTSAVLADTATQVDTPSPLLVESAAFESVSSSALDPSILRCLAFSPYVDGYNPNRGPHPSAALIERLLDAIIKQTGYRCIMTYGAINGLDHVFAAAQQRGLKVIAILWLDADTNVNNASITVGIQKAQQYPNTIIQLSCGSELRTRQVANADGIIGDCISRIKAAGVTQPLGTIDTWWIWCNESWPCQRRGLADLMDWIGVNIHPWWENKYSGIFPCIPADQAADFVLARAQDVASTYPGKDTMVTEFGWPAGPDGHNEENQHTGQRCGIASEANQKLVIQTTIPKLTEAGYSNVTFAALREPWKEGIEGAVGSYWGICQGQPPYICHFRPIRVAAASSALPGWPIGNLLDANEFTAWSSQDHREHLATAEWAAVILNTPTSINQVRIRPRDNANDPLLTLGFPKDFVVQYAYNGQDESSRQLTCNPTDPRFGDVNNWKPLLTYYGYTQPQKGWLTFSFSARQAGCVRVLGTELSQDDYGVRYMQLAEVEVYTGQTKIALTGVATSSALPDWPARNITDANEFTAWSSWDHREHLTSTEWVAAIFSAPTLIDQVRIRPRDNANDLTLTLGFPEDFVLQYSFDGQDEFGRQLTCNANDPSFKDVNNWKPLLTYYGYPQPKKGWLEFSFLPREAGCFRILGTELSQDDYGVLYLQLGEIQLYTGQAQVALGQAVASSALADWPVNSVVDGNEFTIWSSQDQRAHLTTAEWATMALTMPLTIDQVRIRPRDNANDPTLTLGFPKDFVLQYAYDGADETGRQLTCNASDGRFADVNNWKPLAAYYGYVQPKKGWLEFGFTARQAGCFRILGTELSQDDYGVRYLQLAEIEVVATKRE